MHCVTLAQTGDAGKAMRLWVIRFRRDAKRAISIAIQAEPAMHLAGLVKMLQLGIRDAADNSQSDDEYQKHQ